MSTKTVIEESRNLTKVFVGEIVKAYQGNPPGLVIVIIVNESVTEPGKLEIDASAEGGGCYTDKGVARIAEFSKRMNAAMMKAAQEAAESTGATMIDRQDLTIPVVGERPKA